MPKFFMLSRQAFLPALAFAAISFGLSGCTADTILQPVPQTMTISGTVHGGSLPVSGATIQLYAAGTGGDGTGATPLITSTVTSGTDGSFSLRGTFNCPAANPLVYIVATGGNPGLTSGTNPQLSMLTAIGPCLSIGSTTRIAINEVTTVASIATLYPFFSGISTPAYSTLASSTTDAATLLAEFNNFTTLVDSSTGIAKGTSTVANTINSLANSVTNCVNSTGGAAGDTSICGSLFTDITSPYGTVATDTSTALILLFQHPYFNVSAVYGLGAPTAAFNPALTSAPVYWNVPAGSAPSISPTHSAIISTVLTSGSVTITLTSPDPTATIYYFVNRGGTNFLPQVYTAPFSLGLNNSLPDADVYAYTVSTSGAISGMSVGNYSFSGSCAAARGPGGVTSYATICP